jgi:hypothetical protein
MNRPRHLIMTAALAVAFLSAGAFAQEKVPVALNAVAAAPLHVTVISKSETPDFAS